MNRGGTLQLVKAIAVVTIGSSVALCAVLGAGAVAHAADSPEAARRALLNEIAQDVRDTARYLSKRVLDERVMAALEKVPRHEFVPQAERRHAYDNRPLPIGHGQTISQPYIVAVMTDLVEPRPGCRALEVGTGSGYQAAILSELCEKVHTIEIIEALGSEARARLERLGYANVDVRVADGYHGSAAHSPFDVIVVTAVASHIPPPLLAQLKPGGRMILPVGSRFTAQQLVLVSKAADGKITTRQILPIAFVPLTGGH